MSILFALLQQLAQSGLWKDLTSFGYKLPCIKKRLVYVLEEGGDVF